MTGAGFAAGATELGDLRVEVRSVNGRALAVKLRLGAACAGFEVAIEEAVRERLARGTVTVIVERRAATPALPDRAVLRAVAGELSDVAREVGLAPPALADVLAIAGSSGRAEAMTSRPLPPKVSALLASALDDLQRHRRAEGAATRAAMVAELDRFAEHQQQAAALAPRLVDAYRERLLERVREFMLANQVPALTAADVVREVALYADRVDTAEELQRLQAHVAELRATVTRGGEAGRRLEFLLQELLRETNTLGAKSPDVELAHLVVTMKSCVDRLKEQAANVE
jgi:uncharacterized protein (TIGR00255 family)